MRKHVAVCLWGCYSFYQGKNALEKELCSIGATNYAELVLVLVVLTALEIETRFCEFRGQQSNVSYTSDLALFGPQSERKYIRKTIKTEVYLFHSAVAQPSVVSVKCVI